MDNLLALVIVVSAYIAYALPLYIIAKKSEEEYAWLAFVPFANLWLMCQMTDLSLIWLILSLFIPPVACLFQIVVWWRIAENTNKSGFWGVLMVIPYVSFFVGYYLALYEPPHTRY
jgi:uncharacterized membrane protein YhaH (DUF805 family)